MSEIKIPIRVDLDATPEVAIPFTVDIPPEGRLIAQALSDGLASLQHTVDRLSDSERVQVPGHASDAVAHGPACTPLVGEDYPPRWCRCEEAAWQQLTDDVDTDETDNALIEYRDALARSQSLLADP